MLTKAHIYMQVIYSFIFQTNCILPLTEGFWNMSTLFILKELTTYLTKMSILCVQYLEMEI